jgi:ferredoxin-thioredoxin reductase catalytic chain
MPEAPTAASLQRVQKLVQIYTEKSGTTTHPDAAITNVIVLGLAQSLDLLGRPLCPCRFYPNPSEEIQHRTWICACDDMQIYKYCHCLLFVNSDGQPITEYLPGDHEGLRSYGLPRNYSPTLGESAVYAAALYDGQFLPALPRQPAGRPLVRDPTPEKGPPLRAMAAEREHARRERHS